MLTVVRGAFFSKVQVTLRVELVRHFNKVSIL
jgi:hypothetical protein